MSADHLTELGFYARAGHAADPTTIIGEARDGEALGLGSAFLQAPLIIVVGCAVAAPTARGDEMLLALVET